MEIRNLINHLINKIPSKWLFHLYYKKLQNANLGMVISLHRVIKINKSINLNHFIEITDAKLEKLLVTLIKIGVQFVNLCELQQYIAGTKKSKFPIVHISFDDGYRDNYTLAYPLLKKYNIPFSIFVVSDFVGRNLPFIWWYMLESIVVDNQPLYFKKYEAGIKENDYLTKNKEELFHNLVAFTLANISSDKNYFEEEILRAFKQVQLPIPDIVQWADLKEMQLSGLCEIGIHTTTHPRFNKLTDTDRKAEILACKEEIFKHTGIVARYFAYPFGSAEDIGDTSCLQQTLNECGVQLALTTIPDQLNILTNKYLIPRVFINNTSSTYSLKSRLNGTYQARSHKLRKAAINNQ